MFSRADAYERFMGRWSRLLAPPMVAFAGVRDGEVVLDVGSGTGALSEAVRAVNRSGRVVGVDPSAEYVAAAARRGVDDGVRFEVGDARQLPLDDASVDRTVSMLVLNFVPEPARAVGEMMRVTGPGGTVAAAVWDYAGEMEMLRVFWDEVVALDPAAAVRDEGRMPLCRDGELSALWVERGLAGVRADALTIDLAFASFDDYWAPFLLGQGPAGAYVDGLAPERRLELASRLRERVLGGGADRAFAMRARAWAVRGQTPSV